MNLVEREFITIHDYLYYSVFAICHCCTIPAIRYWRLFAIRYTVFPDTQSWDPGFKFSSPVHVAVFFRVPKSTPQCFANSQLVFLLPVSWDSFSVSF